ncbi:hypothetical protein CMV24_07190 [Pseudomonas plecoglossicida]|uniref:Uncharacterized protein n=1 Tax=Pseudomonas plecoglossicida TaxID=70775 RepID=A0A2A3M9M5_PSEDL|nr:hypothetical protein CMV24_07190 [Pseudomonas plecoglossicida]
MVSTILANLEGCQERVLAGRLRLFFCGSGLVSRKGCAAAPAIHAAKLKSRGRFAPLSRHKAAPTENRPRRSHG